MLNSHGPSLRGQGLRQFQSDRQFLALNRNQRYHPGNEELANERSAAGARSEREVREVHPQPGSRVVGGKSFFIWIRRNPSKSPESAKGIQANPRIFA